MDSSAKTSFYPVLVQKILERKSFFLNFEASVHFEPIWGRALPAVTIDTVISSWRSCSLCDSHLFCIFGAIIWISDDIWVVWVVLDASLFWFSFVVRVRRCERYKTNKCVVFELARNSWRIQNRQTDHYLHLDDRVMTAKLVLVDRWNRHRSHGNPTKDSRAPYFFSRL